MFLMIGVIGMVVLVLGCGLFLGLREADEAPLAARGLCEGIPSRFFAQGVEAPVGAAGREVQVPVALLLSQLEQHIRLEEAAVEVFLQAPSVRNLHAPTTSTMVN